MMGIFVAFVAVVTSTWKRGRILLFGKGVD